MTTNPTVNAFIDKYRNFKNRLVPSDPKIRYIGLNLLAIFYFLTSKDSILWDNLVGFAIILPTAKNLIEIDRSLTLQKFAAVQLSQAILFLVIAPKGYIGIILALLLVGYIWHETDGAFE
jgi:hypothetical protein